MISLAGKAALITGGSRGIGAAAVKLFAQAGADVVFNYYKCKEAATQVEQDAAKHGTRVEAFKADVGRHADNKKLVEFAISRLGRLDIVVPNAGVWNSDDLPIEKMTEKQWDEMLRVNLTSVYSIIHFSVPHMIKQKCGKIIPISSTAGQRGESLHTHYGASKGGIISFTKGLASELARHNILVNSGRSGLGCHRHVQCRPQFESRAKKWLLPLFPSGRAAYCGRNRRAHSVSGLRSSQLHDRRGHQCKWRIGLVRLKLQAGVRLSRGRLFSSSRRNFAFIALHASRLLSCDAATRLQNPDTMLPEQRVAKARRNSRPTDGRLGRTLPTFKFASANATAAARNLATMAS